MEFIGLVVYIHKELKVCTTHFGHLEEYFFLNVINFFSVMKRPKVQFSDSVVEHFKTP